MTIYTTTVTATNSADNTLTVTTVANMTIGMPITFSGVVFGAITTGSTYYILQVVTANTIKISSLPGGAIFAVTTGTGSMTATFTAGGQQIIVTEPPGEPLESAFNKVNVNFDQIFAAGPVGSNIAIANNTIRTLDTNGNLVLAPNGIGRVVANVDILPNTANIRNLGSSSNRWGILYVNNLDISGNISLGNVSVAGNLSVARLNTSNITGNTVTITATTGDIVLNAVGNIDVGNRWINNLAYPVQDQDAANKLYVDTVAQGLDPKASVVAASRVALPAYTYNNGASGIGATLTAQASGALSLDGINPTTGQRVLIKNETGPYINPTTMSAAFNGIYVVVNPGSVTDAYVLIRATDFDQSTEISSAFTFVETGSTLADTGWVCSTDNPIVIGTTQIVWVQFSGAGSYTAGNGLSLLGTQFNVNVDPNTTEINGNNQVAVKPSANLVTPNIGAATGTSLSVTGNITAANMFGNIVGPIPTSTNILYVAKNGNDANNGTINQPFLTIRAAMTVATAGTSVHVAPGAYTEINPITIPANVALMGDNLRSVFVTPATPANDLFYMRGGTYVWGITIRDYLANGFSYDPATPSQNVFVSPYVQNITSSTTIGTAVFIDGNATSAVSTKAMILGFFTIINRGGRGVYLVNSAYSQAVNIYTIACDIGLKVESGAFMTLNGSDCSIGNFGLIADGVGPLQTSGTTVGTSSRGIFVVTGLTNGQPHVNTVMRISGDPIYYTIDVILPNVPTVGDSTVIVQQVYLGDLAGGTNVEFFTRSSIIASAHTFEYVGAGTDPATALPQYGGIPIEANEVIQTNGGVVTFTSTDQKGNFKVGSGFTINQATGEITGDYFYRSLFAQMTPYILALSS
jgi:hypothetical protein